LRISQHVTCAIDDGRAGKPDAALLHACVAVDATAKRLYPSEASSRRRFIKCVRHYYWLVEPMVGAGINLIETRFTNISLAKTRSPDFAEIVYEVLRCSHAHGEEVPVAFSVVPSQGDFLSSWEMSQGELHIPDRIVWALLGIAVFSKVNHREKSTGSYYLSLGAEKFPLTQWWGGEDRLQPIAGRHNKTRVILNGLDGMRRDGAGEAGLIIRNPPFI
jgi:hypothetical protein